MNADGRVLFLRIAITPSVSSATCTVGRNWGDACFLRLRWDCLIENLWIDQKHAWVSLKCQGGPLFDWYMFCRLARLAGGHSAHCPGRNSTFTGELPPLHFWHYVEEAGPPRPIKFSMSRSSIHIATSALIPWVCWWYEITFALWYRPCLNYTITSWTTRLALVFGVCNPSMELSHMKILGEVSLTDWLTKRQIP